MIRPLPCARTDSLCAKRCNRAWLLPKLSPNAFKTYSGKRGHTVSYTLLHLVGGGSSITWSGTASSPAAGYEISVVTYILQKVHEEGGPAVFWLLRWEPWAAAASARGALEPSGVFLSTGGPGSVPDPHLQDGATAAAAAGGAAGGSGECHGQEPAGEVYQHPPGCHGRPPCLRLHCGQLRRAPHENSQ